MEGISKNKKKVSVRSILIKTLGYLVLSAGGLIMLYPLIFGLLGSVTSNEEFMETMFLPLPKNIPENISNFAIVFKRPGNITFFGKENFSGVVLSLLITAFKFLFNTTGVIITSVVIAYIFAKMRFTGKETVFTVLMVGMMIPGVAMLIPNYVFLKSLGFVDNFFGQLFVTGWVGVYNIFLIRQTFEGLDNSFREAAQIDGASFMRIIFGIYFPMIKPVIAVITLNSFVGTWNEYMGQLIFLPNKIDLWTIGAYATKIISYFSGIGGTGYTQYPKVFAISMITIIPPIIMYAALQKQFVQGLSFGGVKG
jgi:ABC-type glycerol-3-phosphate transport system permease component